MTPPEVTERRIAAFVPDLLDRSKVAAAGDVTFVSSPDALSEVDADVVVVDLMRPGVLEVLPTLSARVIGFARHTEPALMAAAQAAGCHVVVPRSTFFAQMDDLLAG